MRAKYFADNHVSFNENNKRTLHLIDADGYYTNAALLLSDQCEHSIKCAVYEGNGKPNSKPARSLPARFSGRWMKHTSSSA